MNEAKILLIDIETSPIVAHVWQMKIWKSNVRPEQVLQDTSVLSFAAKWLNNKDIIYQDQSKCKDIRNDKQLLLSVRKLLDEAHIVVVQNGEAFDIPTLKARMISQGIKPPSPFKMIDTCLLARKEFNFTYNNLDFLATSLNCKTRKYSHKKFNGMSLWNNCLTGNQKAWAEMKKYNIQDVIVLEEVYLALRAWIPNHPNVGMFCDSDSPVCPKCGGDVRKDGFYYTNIGKYQQYQCKNDSCGGWARSRQAEKDERKKLQLNN